MAQYALFHRRPGISRFLIEKGADVDFLEEAPHSRKLATAFDVVNRGGRIASVGPDRETLLCSQILLQAQADPSTEHQGVSAFIKELRLGGTVGFLHFTILALTFRQISVKLMLDHWRGCIDVNGACGPKSHTPLFQALKGGCWDIGLIKLLLRYGGDVKRSHKDGDTPPYLYYALRGSMALRVYEFHELLCMLIRAGADIHATGPSGETPSRIACKRRSDYSCSVPFVGPFHFGNGPWKNFDLKLRQIWTRALTAYGYDAEEEIQSNVDEVGLNHSWSKNFQAADNKYETAKVYKTCVRAFLQAGVRDPSGHKYMEQKYDIYNSFSRRHPLRKRIAAITRMIPPISSNDSDSQSARKVDSAESAFPGIKEQLAKKQRLSNEQFSTLYWAFGNHAQSTKAQIDAVMQKYDEAAASEETEEEEEEKRGDADVRSFGPNLSWDLLDPDPENIATYNGVRVSPADWRFAHERCCKMQELVGNGIQRKGFSRVDKCRFIAEMGHWSLMLPALQYTWYEPRASLDIEALKKFIDKFKAGLKFYRPSHRNEHSDDLDLMAANVEYVNPSKNGLGDEDEHNKDRECCKCALRGILMKTFIMRCASAKKEGVRDHLPLLFCEYFVQAPKFGDKGHWFEGSVNEGTYNWQKAWEFHIWQMERNRQFAESALKRAQMRLHKLQAASNKPCSGEKRKACALSNSDDVEDSDGIEDSDEIEDSDDSDDSNGSKGRKGKRRKRAQDDEDITHRRVIDANISSELVSIKLPLFI